MNRAQIGLLVFFLVSCCYAADESWRMEDAAPFSGSFLLDMPSSNGKATVSIDTFKTVKSFNFLLQPADSGNKFAVAFLSKEDGYRRAFALRGKYSFRFNILERGNFVLANESTLALGILDGAYLMEMGDSRFKFAQMLFGLRDGFTAKVSAENSRFGVRMGADVSAARLSDNYGNETVWDSLSARYGIFAESRLAKNVLFQVNADEWRKKYNPDKYFFVEKWASETRVSAETTFSLNNRVDLVPLFGYRRFDLERNERPDLERLEYGGRLILKVGSSSDKKLFLNGIYAPWRHKSGYENLISAGVESSGLSAEVFRRQTEDSYSTFEITERIIGARLAWKFGNAGRKDLDSYGKTVKEKYDFYRDNGIKDNSSLTRIQQAERLDTIRKVTEYAGNNFRYFSASNNGWGFRNADEAYNLRGGDCDEQSCTTVSMDRLNGYKAYNLNYYDLSQWRGHGVELVQDKTNGQWFLSEYGTMFKVNVSPDASLETIAREAVVQNHQDLSLVISDPTRAYYEVIDCSIPGIYQEVTNFINIGSMSMQRHRPNVEYGAELFIGRNFLFGD